MIDLGDTQYFLGIQVYQSSFTIFITQSKYINDILAMFSMNDCKLVDTSVVLGTKLIKENYTPLVDSTM